MALNRTQLINQQILNPIIDLQATEIPPLDVVTPPEVGKYVFMYDYATTIYTPEAQEIMRNSPVGIPYNLPAGSFFDLIYSKGDVVNVTNVSLSKNTNPSIPYLNKFAFRLKVPPYVKPLEQERVVTLKGGNFSPFMMIDNNLGWLNKVANTTPTTLKLGKNFGKNLNPKVQPVTPTQTPTGTTTTPVVTNGVEDTTETKSFFDDKNNLLMIAGVILIGYLLLNDKTE